MKTERLTLRSLVEADATRIASLAGAWEIASMTGRIPFPYSADAAKHWVTGLADGEMVFGIDHNGELIGICGYTLEGNRAAQLGYWIGQPYWGQGFATEAAHALIDYGFMKGGVRRFIGRHFTDNHGSARVIQKLGFRASGTGTGWCEARQQEFAVLNYELRRPWTTALRALAS
ncbi:MAG: GNAT family N-acetyltransferase [Hyphomicrobium sp.]